jgi:predicted nucleic acid-binding protein
VTKQMNDRVFVDTNIFVYMQSSTEEEKRDVSKRVVDTFVCVASIQVLNEISNVLIKKTKLPIDNIVDFIDGIVQTCELAFISYETIRNALDLSKKYHFSYCDSLIIASALESNCKYLFSEDLQDGQLIEKQLTIVNIFENQNLLQ